MTTIDEVQALPTSPFAGSGLVAIVITSGVPSYFKVVGSELSNIISFNWYPENRASVIFETRQFIPVDDTIGTCMVKVTDNLLDITDRGGRISFQINDGSTISFPVVTYGPTSVGPLWTAPAVGLNTG
jgi:hypothetical protein